MAPATRSKSVRVTLMVVLALNAVSAAIKVGVGAHTGSITVLGAALESVLDMMSNAVAVLAVSVAARAPDDDHPYGHEKFETLGTLAIVVFLSITCFELLRQSFSQLSGHQSLPRATPLDAIMLVTSLAVNLFVVLYERRRGRTLSSNLLLADSAHELEGRQSDTRRRRRNSRTLPWRPDRDRRPEEIAARRRRGGLARALLQCSNRCWRLRGWSGPRVP